MKKIILIISGILFCILQSIAYASTDKPNILIIVADDLGYSDLGCYGGEIQTPNLDQLAAKGLRFTQFYNSGRCWPSRASLLTGYYAQSIRRDILTGFQREPGDPLYGTSGVRPGWAQLIPEYLRKLGYHSYHSGKWHLDGSPLENGFDHSYLYMIAEGYFGAINHTEDGVKLPPVLKDESSGYSVIRTADYAIKYLKEHEEKYPDKPFFVYLAFNCPHFPIQALPGDIAIYKDRYALGWDVIREERFKRQKNIGFPFDNLSALDSVTIPAWNLPEEELQERISKNEVGHAVPWNRLTQGQKEFQSAKMAVHAAMIHRMDMEIGRVLDQLKATNALKNTIIMFVSDNGASPEQIIRGGGHDPNSTIGSAESFLGIGPGWSSAANTPFRLHKSWNHEGGICTPFIVCWPDGIKAHGELRNNPAHLIDLLPTLLDITGARRAYKVSGLKTPPLPGKSLVPAFSRDGSVQHDLLWWNHSGNRAIRIGDWKLVADHQSPWELYDLKTDRSETRNLADIYPEKVFELEKAWKKQAMKLKKMSLQDPPSDSRNTAK